VAEERNIKVAPFSESGVVIAGGTSGVGLAAARQFTAAGVTRLVLLGRNEQRGAAARDAVRAASPEAQVEFLAADANDPAQAVAVIERARELIGSIDVLVNSTTANYVPTLLHEMPIEDMAGILTQQALAPMHMTRAALPVMREQRGGAIINIASDAGKVATPGESVLGAAMAAIVMFSRGVAIEGKRDGVRVNAITPSLIVGTPTGDRSLAGGFSAKLFTKALQQAHLGATEPDDLAGLIVFLASPAAARLTGQAISLNGGISAA
jgi:NAD(P)-dependent dehydrogenase (short-subunit alcohol dehydrogenase family)